MYSLTSIVLLKCIRGDSTNVNWERGFLRCVMSHECRKAEWMDHIEVVQLN